MSSRSDEINERVWKVRALRADPPAAAASGQRGEVFQAALEQFEQLFRASAVVGAASSPLTLFYALSQAGRAIVAAHGGDADTRIDTHGLGVSEGDPIGSTVITPRTNGLFPAVAEATGSPRLTAPVTLADVWAGSPWFVRAPGLGEDRLPLLQVSEDLVIRSAEGGPFLAEDFRRHQAEYPGAAEATIDERAFDEGRNAGLSILPVRPFSTTEARDAFLGGLVPWLGGSRFLRVPLGEKRDQPSGLMTWWIALIALSSLARYEPAGWTAALDPTSVLAVPIERTLSNVSLMLPLLVARRSRHRPLTAASNGGPASPLAG